MKAQTQTIEQLSRVLDVAERKVSRTARRVLGLTSEMVRDPALMLSRNHCRQIAQALGKPDPWVSASTPFALSSPRPARRPAFKRDPCAKGELAFGGLSESRALFAAATARLGRRQAGPWENRDAALHAEVRAMLLGLAVPGDTDSIPAGGLVRLSDATYRDRRAGHEGVGRAAASALLKVAEHVGPDAFVGIFPELAAATAAVRRLRDGELPEGFAEFDRVVVDEVQDLTLLETAVVVELCLAIARRRGHAPWLLAAGDDGQPCVRRVSTGAP